MWRYGCAGLVLLMTTACFDAPPMQSMALVGGDITAATPPGYCLDGSASRPGDGFAVIAPCAAFGGDDAVPRVVGVATIQVGLPDSGIVAGAETGLRDLLVSDAGAALLSAAGGADTITVLGSQVQDNMVKVHFTDTAAPPMAGLQDHEWRAFLDLKGRLVTVAVRGPADAPLTDGTGAWLLDQLVNALVRGDGADTGEA